MDTTPINPFFQKLFVRYVFLNWKSFVTVMKCEIKEQKAKDPTKPVDQIRKDYLTHVTITGENEQPEWEDNPDKSDPRLSDIQDFDQYLFF